MAAPVGDIVIEAEIAVVGGGLVGLATARALLERRPDSSVVVLEGEKGLARHQSGHNSGVIHSGLYYRPGSLKAQTCIEGREALYRYCEDRQLPHRRCGKLVVAVEGKEIPGLEELERRGRANGLEGLRRLTPREIREVEPAVQGIDGLWVEETGVVDYRAVAASYARDVAEAGGCVVTDARVVAVERRGEALQLRTAQGSYRCNLLVNCAGLWSDRLARMCGVEPGIRIVPFRGEYLHVGGGSAERVRGLVYPVPDPDLPFLGVHLTRGVDGEVEAGPNAVLALRRAGYRWRDVSLRDSLETLSYAGFWRFAARFWRTGLGEIYRSVVPRGALRALRRLMPEIRAEDLSPGGAGVRAQALDPRGRPLDDFHIVEAPGMVHVLNAPSPGATASLAIGRRIAALVSGEKLPEDGCGTE